MDAIETPPPDQTDTPEGERPPPDRVPGDPGAGTEPSAKAVWFTPYLEKAKRALERAGMRVAPAGNEPVPSGSDTAPNAPDTAAAVAAVAGLDSPGAPVADRPAFDEAVTRTGVQSLVETADALAAQFVTAKAVDIVGKSEAAGFGDRVKMTPAIKESMVNAGVEVCRVENVNVPPHATLVVLLGGWLYGIHGAIKDLKTIATDAGKKEPAK